MELVMNTSLGVANAKADSVPGIATIVVSEHDAQVC
jgi:hypothetical protein